MDEEFKYLFLRDLMVYCRVQYMKMILQGNLRGFSAVLALMFAAFFQLSTLGAQDLDLDNGKALFKANCAQCHNRNMRDDLTGPALGMTEENWADYPREELYQWIRNSQVMIDAGHPRAVELWSEWGPTVMNPFPNLTDQQIEDLLGYISGVYSGTYGAPAGGADVVASSGAAATAPNRAWVYWLILGFLVTLAIIFAKLILDLQSLEARTRGEFVERKSLFHLLTSKTVISFVVLAAVLLGGYTTVNNAIALNRQQGYQPDQPIKFSHATHAGLHKIDCQYCHDGARRSKHSVIPATSTCMNCHSAIKVGSKYGTQELTKIYASIGFDPSKDEYIDNYDNLESDKVAEVFKSWIQSQVMKREGIEKLVLSADKDMVNREVDEQWSHIVSSLTNDTKKKVQGPIEWVRIHNLPDHVYFNHAQHVTVAELECQQCHGPVEEMEIVEQYAPLSMGWCVNCHRQTEITTNMSNSEYYMAHYEELIKEHKEKGDAITVEDIGGIECQKCHY